MTAPLVGLFLLLYLPALVHSVYAAVVGPDEDRRRLDTGRALQGLLQQVVLGGVLAITWWVGWWRLADVRLWPQLLAVPVGLLGWWALRWLQPRLVPASSPDPWDHLQALKRLWPRSAAGQTAMTLSLCANPFTEELVTRGIFVLMVREATGSLPLAVGFGLVVNLALHAYQGVRHLPWHAAFYAVSVALALSPVGLLGAIVLHLCGDLVHLDGRPTLAWIRSIRRS